MALIVSATDSGASTGTNSASCSAKSATRRWETFTAIDRTWAADNEPDSHASRCHRQLGDV